MTLTITIDSPTTAIVHREPSWLERWLLGRDSSTTVAVRIQSIGDRHIWLDDNTGRAIRDERVLERLQAA